MRSYICGVGRKLCDVTSICVYLDIVQYLLEETTANNDVTVATNRKVDVGNTEGRTCLHIAAITNNVELLTYLLNKQNASRTVKWQYKVNNYISVPAMLFLCVQVQ